MKRHIVLLIGGVGGAKLALGLAKLLPPDELSIIVNTGDDFEHLGLAISPDLDTVTYTLAGISSQQMGWGLQGDTLQAMAMVRDLGGPAWFNLGDRDLGLSLMRTHWLRQGEPLSEITARIRTALGVEHPILPMSDDPVHTMIETDKGELAFQEYFVRERWQPIVRAIRFEGAGSARPAPGVIETLERATQIVIGPSNPFLSIDPIFAIPAIRAAIEGSHAPRTAVSPLIGGQAIKGPTAKLMGELGLKLSVMGIVDHYEKWLDLFILDDADSAYEAAIQSRGIDVLLRPTLMTSLADRVQLARAVVDAEKDPQA